MCTIKFAEPFKLWVAQPCSFIAISENSVPILTALPHTHCIYTLRIHNVCVVYTLNVYAVKCRGAFCGFEWLLKLCSEAIKESDFFFNCRELIDGQKEYVIRRRKQLEKEQEEKEKVAEANKQGLLQRKESKLVNHSTPLTATLATRQTNVTEARPRSSGRRSSGPTLMDLLEEKMSPVPVQLPPLEDRRSPATAGRSRRKNATAEPPKLDSLSSVKRPPSAALLSVMDTKALNK